MTKKDLRPGMIVQYSNREYGIVMTSETGLYIASNNTILSVSSLAEDLSHKYENCNIDRVFISIYSHPIEKIFSGEADLKLLWERPIQVEWTIGQIESKLGLKPGTLRIKK